MYLFTILLLLFSITFIQISTIKLVRAPRLRTRKFNGQFDECVCFPAGQSLIPELLNPQGNGLERLVVFLYRDTNTNQIKMFMPSPDKQPLIPNIPFEVGDVLKTITTETIASLFAPKQEQTFTEALPIGLNWGKIEHTKSPKPAIVAVQNIPQQSYPQQSYPQQIYLPNIYNPNQNQQIPSPSNQVKYQVTTNQNIYSWAPKNPYQPYSQANPYVIKFPARPTPINVPINKPRVFPAEGGLAPERLTFDQWFNRQMAIFQDAKSPQDIKSINTDLLRALVQKTLFENHMHIGSSGLITDANGVPINLNNLELRPILIGNSVPYQQALTGDQQLALPKHLPYLEGILITLIYPPKILGVIPLGKTYVGPNPQAVAPSALIEHYYTELDAVPISASTGSNPFSSTNYPNSQWVSPQAYPILNPGVNYNTISNPQLQNANSAFYSGGVVPYSESNPVYANYLSGPIVKGIWERRSNKRLKKQKTKPSKQKGHETSLEQSNKPTNDSDNSPKDASNASKSKWIPWFKKAGTPPGATSRNGRKAGSSFDSWDSPPSADWQYYPIAKNSPLPNPADDGKAYLSTSPVQNQWTSSSTDVKYYPPSSSHSWSFSSSNSSQYKPNSNLVAPPITGVSNVGPGPSNSWHTQNSLSASPYVDSNQNSYSNTQVISQPISHTSYQKTNWNSPPTFELGPQLDVGTPNWHPIITTTAYPPITNYPVKSPYLRSEPSSEKDISSVDTTALEEAIRIKTLPIINTLVKMPEFKYPFVSENPSLYTVNDTQSQNKSSDSGSMQNEGRPLGGTRRFPLPIIQGVIKALVSMVIQNMSQEINGRRSELIQKEPLVESSINVSNHIEKTGVDEEGERPDFRIIGGSAATGSGSPLSNKGRSGLNVG